MTAVLLALGAAFCNALNVVTQHVASTSGPSKGFFRVARYLLRDPLWLLGLGAIVGAFVLQALALYDGKLSVVQSLLVTELVFALILRRLWFRFPVTSKAWVAASITSVGLAVFVVMAEPHGGHAAATGKAWVAAVATMGGAAAGMVVLASGGSPTRRAGLYASAAGVTWALTATFIKSTTDAVANDGLWGAFHHWPIYAVALGGIAGSLLTQAALHTGPLSVSQPLMIILDPVASVILSIWLFGEHFTDDLPKIVAAGAGFVIMIVGVVMMCRTAAGAVDVPAAAPDSVRPT